MLAKFDIPELYKEWNKRNNAPFGNIILNKKVGSLLPKALRLTKLGSYICGKYFYQPNSKTRLFEYPWAFYASDIKKKTKILEIGGSLSGFNLI